MIYAKPMNANAKTNSDDENEFGCSSSEFDRGIRMMKGFGDRVRWVIGREQWTPWAVRHGFAPSTVDGWLKGEITPYRKTLEKLEEKTGIPAEWWKSGEGPPPGAARAMGGAVSSAPPQSSATAPTGQAPSAAPPDAQTRQGVPASGLHYRAQHGFLPASVANEPAAAYFTAAADRLLVRITGLVWSLDWIPQGIAPGDREALALSAAACVLAAAGHDGQAITLALDSDLVLEDAIRLCWHTAQAVSRPPPRP